MTQQVDNLIFSLDVGTRKVAGLLVREVQGQARVEAVSVREHSERAMMDGQVHFIEKAAQVVKRVKQDLENESGLTLDQVHVAVAGRALATEEATVTHEFASVEVLGRAELLPLELQAVKEAKMKLKDARASTGSYCVGYAVTHAELDGVALGALQGHQGRQVSMTVLATFLPKLVLDSLQAVLRAAGLSMAGLTLEPIAALDIAIPPDLRRLNLALVDVGAGTSDIAMTKDGVVTSFAMVPLAGDEVTEALCGKFVVDFEQAERIKRGLNSGPEIACVDIFGKEVSVSAAEAKETVKPVVEDITRAVATQILELNGGQAPQAALLVGGGSQIEGFDKGLAEKLGLPASRVGHRPPNLQKDFSSIPAALNEVWGITPLGIALIALRGRGLPFMSFEVNGQTVQVLNLNQRVTAFDALIAGGREMREFYGKPGLALTFTLNGEPRIVKGGMGTPARLLLEGREINFDQEIEEGAKIVFENAQPGEDGRATVAEALTMAGMDGITLVVNGEEQKVWPEVLVNGSPAKESDSLVDRAELTAKLDRTAEALLRRLGHDMTGLVSRDITVRVDGMPRVIHQRNYRLKVNAEEAALNRPLTPGDRVDFEPGISFHERVRDLLSQADLASLSVKLNGQWTRVPVPAKSVTMNGRPVSLDEYLIDGAEIVTQPRTDLDLPVEDLLKQMSLDSIALRQGTVRVLVDGEAVTVGSRINDGADVQIEPGVGLG